MRNRNKIRGVSKALYLVLSNFPLKMKIIFDSIEKQKQNKNVVKFCHSYVSAQIIGLLLKTVSVVMMM